MRPKTGLACNRSELTVQTLSNFTEFDWPLFPKADVQTSKRKLISGAALRQKQWDGLHLNLNGIAMCQTEEANIPVTK